MDYYSRLPLSNVFEEISEWRKRKDLIPDQVEVHWNEFHLSVVQCYVLNSGINCGSRFLSIAKLLNDTPWYTDPESYIIYAKMVASFTQLLQQFFLVPRPHQFFDRKKTIKRNEVVAAFIEFLLQLLYFKTELRDPFKDRIDILEKELRLILTFLGDAYLLLCDKHEQVQNLVPQFEAAANQAGSLLHYFFFSKNRVFETMDESFGDILKQIGLLKGNITKFLDLLPFISRAPNTSTVNSSVIVHSLLYDLEDILNQDDSKIADVKDLIRTFQQGLSFSRSLIKDIGEPQLSEIEELKESVMRIGDVAYEAEFLINSFLVRHAPFWYLSIRLSHVVDKIKLNGTELQEIKKNHHLGALKVREHFMELPSVQGKGNSDVDVIIVGFEEKAIDILDQLVHGTEQLQTICIYGMPGLGKTTMAKKLYNHPSVRCRFDKCSWCIVSHTYKKLSTLTEILISLATERNRILNKEEEDLVLEIHKSLKGRRYLIVLDDIWSSHAWDDLQRCFPNDGNGSRILFTSRNKDVAPSDCKFHALPLLSDEQCWELLEKKVFHKRPCPPELQGIGKGIAKHCCGLPLAVVVIAGVLSALNEEETTWIDVGENFAKCIFSDQNNSTMQILELSYKHLPEHLKPCFLYFRAFVQYKEIPVRKLMRLWVAEGFILTVEKKTSESLAEKYLMELIDKSLVMVGTRRSDGGVRTCVVHDLLRDLCLKICEEENFMKLVDHDNLMYEKGCRLLSFQHLPTPFGHRVRSFHGHPPESAFFIVDMKLFRVLNFQQANMSPQLIGTEFLVQLRYLVIGDHMPESIGSLVNLEFLRVEEYAEIEIPLALLKMVKLRYLQITSIASFGKDCNSSQFNNLELLSRVHVRELKDEEMLKCSPHLRRLKCRCEALWKEEKGAYQYPDFSFFTHLESLNLTTDQKTRIEYISLPAFPLSIKKLTLSELCLPWENMSIIGELPNLQVLKLLSSSFVGEIWETKDCEFEQLTFLKLQHLDILTWNVASSEHFPKLQQLLLHECYNLQEIPSEIGEIFTLQSIEVVFCTAALMESATKIQQEQRDMGNEEFRVVTRTGIHPFYN